MKDYPFLRWIGAGLLEVLLFFIGVFLVIPIYPFRQQIRANKKNNFIYIFWLFLNDTTPVNDNDLDYGDYGRFKHNFLGFYRQNAIRNSHWNFRKVFYKLQKGKAYMVKYTNNSDKTLRFFNLDQPLIYGYQNVTFYVNKVKYFRFSFTKEIFGVVVNLMFGMDKRYIYKIRYQF